MQLSFENLLRDAYLHCTFNKNGRCYFRCPEDIIPITLFTDKPNSEKELFPNITTPQLYEDCFKYEDVLKVENEKALMKTKFADIVKKTENMLPFHPLSYEFQKLNLLNNDNVTEIPESYMEKSEEKQKSNLIHRNKNGVPRRYIIDKSNPDRIKRFTTPIRTRGLLLRNIKGNYKAEKNKKLSTSEIIMEHKKLAMIGIKCNSPHKNIKTNRITHRETPIKITTRINPIILKARNKGAAKEYIVGTFNNSSNNIYV